MIEWWVLVGWSTSMYLVGREIGHAIIARIDR